MPIQRIGHAAIRLTNGQVLIAGGQQQTNGPASASAEIFDPATNTWSNAASILTARFGHTATLLSNGQVLIVGGASGPQFPVPALTSAEIYDPATKTWSNAAPLAVPRAYHTATTLLDGRVLVCGGGPLSAGAEIFNPATGAWSSGGNLTIQRADHTMSLLVSGQVLVAGGVGVGGPLAHAEIYDPASNSWLPTASLSTARYTHTATLHPPSGQVIVAGGWGPTPPDSNPPALVSGEMYNPTTRKWSPIGSLLTAHTTHTATLMPNNQIRVVGGYNRNFLASTEVFDTATVRWGGAGNLAVPRSGHTATLLPSGQLLVYGGVNSGGVLASPELI